MPSNYPTVVPEPAPRLNCIFSNHAGKYYEDEASQFLHLKFKDRNFINKLVKLTTKQYALPEKKKSYSMQFTQICIL